MPVINNPAPAVEAALDAALNAYARNAEDWRADHMQVREDRQNARAALLALIRSAITQQPERGEHGYMPTNLAHKLMAFAAEPEGTVNSKMIAWSLHRMLNAQPIASSPSAPDEAAMRIASKWRHANWCVMLDPEEPLDECTCGLDDYLAGRVSQSVRATFETWWESERLNPGINYSAAFEAGYRAALRGDKS